MIQIVLIKINIIITKKQNVLILLKMGFIAMILLGKLLINVMIIVRLA
jgi:hypothetical protein